MQVGDPFTEKLLLEASLELIRSGAIVAIQDMGAAGLTSSSAEMAARGDVGVTIDTTKVPVREEGMTPYEILLSESQERMLVVAKRGREDEVDGDSLEVGSHRRRHRRSDRRAGVSRDRGRSRRRRVPRHPPRHRLSDVHARSAAESAEVIALRARDVIGDRRTTPKSAIPLWTLTQLLSSPTIASKTWVHRQYDTSVRTNTVIGPGGDAAVVRVRGTDRALALKTDCNGRYVYSRSARRRADRRLRGGAQRRVHRRRARWRSRTI